MPSDGALAWYLASTPEAGKIELRRGMKLSMITTPFNSGPELHLDRRGQEPNHGAAHIFGVQVDLGGGADERHGVGRIGAHEDEVRIGGRDRAHHRHEVGG